MNSASDSPAEAFICEAVRTPIGRYGGALAAVRADDLAAIPIAALLDAPPALRGRRIGIIVSGGNLDLDHLPWNARPGADAPRVTGAP